MTQDEANRLPDLVQEDKQVRALLQSLRDQAVTALSTESFNAGRRGGCFSRAYNFVEHVAWQGMTDPLTCDTFWVCAVLLSQTKATVAASCLVSLELRSVPPSTGAMCSPNEVTHRTEFLSTLGVPFDTVHSEAVAAVLAQLGFPEMENPGASGEQAAKFAIEAVRASAPDV